ncbi:MAG TPA: hypothetical protein VMB27_26355 [Solirubrobacteraceae bacterium]|nr:hypothetical protein [Solirubrobacteraceae bacterium]
MAQIQSLAGGRSEQLARLVYELLDAHADTEQLSRRGHDDLVWAAHLDYLRDLQRVAREVLAHVS